MLPTSIPESEHLPIQNCLYEMKFSLIGLYLTAKDSGSMLVYDTYILLQGCAPNCYQSSNKTFCINTDIGDCTDSNTKQNQNNTKLCVP